MKHRYILNVDFSQFIGLAVVSLLFISLFCSKSVVAQESTHLITYGAQAGTREGDDDFLQVLFLQIPVNNSETQYVRIFDADCGGRLDAQYRGEWDTKTRFRLYGGKGAYPAPELRKSTPDKEFLYSGVLLADETYGVDPFRDHQWYNFATISPDSGEKNGAFRYFKLVVEGISGNDGNVFEVEISRNSLRNKRPDGAEVTVFTPTVRLPKTKVFSEMWFFAPQDMRELTVHNFDVSGGFVGVETAFRSSIPVTVSNQDSWTEGTVKLQPNEVGRYCGIRFEGGQEMPNDATFYVTDEKRNPLPIRLPIFIRSPNSRPEPRINIEYLADCNSVLFDGSKTRDEDGDAMKFFWDFGDGFTGEGSRLTHRYNTPGKYEASLLVEDESGYISNSIIQPFQVNVNYPPMADAGVDQIGHPGLEISFDGSGSSDKDGKITSYLWDFGDGKKARGAVVTHRYKQPDFYQVMLRVEDNSESPCNYNTDIAEVWINAQPVVDIGDDRIASPLQRIELSGSRSYDSDGGLTAYQWDMGDGTTKTGVNIDHAYEKPGTYTVKLTITDDAGTGNSTAEDELKVFVNDPPVADAGTDHRVAKDEKILFDASGSIDRDGKLIAYTWDFGDGAKDSGRKVKHPYSSPGRYWVVLTVQDNSTSTSDTDIDSALVIINFPPEPDAGPDQWLTRSEVSFDAGGSYDNDGDITRYNWDFGDGSSGSGARPVHPYGNPGVYTVRLTITDDSKTSTQSTSDEMTVKVNHAPVADAGTDQIGSPGETIRFDAKGSIDIDGEISEFIWDFGDGKSGSGANVSHVYDKPGRYTALLTVRDNSGHREAISYDDASVWINKLPVAQAGFDVLAAPGENITFNGSNSFDFDGKITSYRWDFSDGKKTSRKSVTKRSFEAPGMYTAILTVTDNSEALNSVHKDQLIVRVNHTPISRSGKNVHTCERTIVFDGGASTDADGDKLSYIWNFGDGSEPGAGRRVIHTYLKSGTYPVILTVNDGTGLSNASATSAITVRINQAPLAVIGDDMTVCAGDVVIFNGGNSLDHEGGLLKYTWDFGDGTTAEGINPTKVYKKGGVYRATLLVEDDSGLPNCNMSTDQIVVWVAESPVADAGSDQTVCANALVRFDGSKSQDVDGLVNQFLWDFGDGGTGGGANPSHVYAQPGEYRVILTITGDRIGNCDNTASDEVVITVFESPVSAFTQPSRAARDELIAFDGSKSSGSGANIIQWAWDFGDSTYGEGEKVEHTYRKSGKYIVTLKVTTDSETNCSETFTQNLIDINEGPIADAGPDQLLGIRQVVTFDGSASFDQDGAINSFIWDFGDKTHGAGVQVRHEYPEAGKYTVILTVTDDTEMLNNTSYDTLYVEVNDTPKPRIIVKERVSVTENVTFSSDKSVDAATRMSKYSWDFGDGDTDNGEVVTHSYAVPGYYTAVLEVDDGNGVSNSRAQATARIFVNQSPKAHAGNDRIVSPDEIILFDGSLSTDRDGKLIEYKWDFGDGQKSDGKSVKHSYRNPGNYDITLTVKDDSETSSSTAQHQISARVNTPPVAVAGADQTTWTGGAHDVLVFDASGSHDADGDPLSFYWDFGDGTNAYGSIVTHSYTKAGDYIVRLKVNDGTGTNSGIVWDELKVQAKIRN